MWESRAEPGRQVGQPRATERKSGRRLLDREAGVCLAHSVFTLLLQLQKVRREGQLAEQHLHPQRVLRSTGRTTERYSVAEEALRF